MPDINSFILTIFVVLLLLGFLVLFLINLFRGVRYRRANLQTEGELRFFKVLKNALGNKYDIFAQVRLASVVNIPDKFFLWRDFSPLGAKSVDFVLCDKRDGKTLLVIELDDKSHRLAKRRKRDKFVNEVLKKAGISIIHIKYQGYYDQESLLRLIETSI